MIDWTQLKTAEQKQSEADWAAWETLRAQRDRLLAACDWAVLPDVDPPGGYQAWATYRQALRDLPGQLGDPAAVIWPDAPV